MAELESITTELLQRGHTLSSLEESDVHIINSCGVTVRSDRKTRGLLNRATSGMKPEGRVLLVGCGASENRQEGKISFITNDYKYLVPDIAENPDLINKLDEYPPERFRYPAATMAQRNRINIKIQDGCNRFCSYCIIPYLRGKPVSRKSSDILQEVAFLVNEGYHEFLLTGVMIGHYHHETTDLATLVQQLLEIKGSFRIHLSSIAPDSVTPQLLRLMAHPKMVKHMNLSLQSGSNSILTRMNRRYTREEYQEIVTSLRQIDPLFNITTDIIVGFPGEEEDDFNDTLQLVQSVGFSHIHTFRYSPRPGTAAAEWGDPVHESEKKERSSRIIETCNRHKEEYYSHFDGKISRFLSEQIRNGETTGFNEYYVPLSVKDSLERNTFYDVRLRYDSDLKKIIGTAI